MSAKKHPDAIARQKREITRPDHPRPVLTVERGPPYRSLRPRLLVRIQHALHDARRFPRRVIHRVRRERQRQHQTPMLTRAQILPPPRQIRPHPRRDLFHPPLSLHRASARVVPTVLLRARFDRLRLPPPIPLTARRRVDGRRPRSHRARRRLHPSSLVVDVASSRRRPICAVRAIVREGFRRRGSGSRTKQYLLSLTHTLNTRNTTSATDRLARADRSIESIPRDGGARARRGTTGALPRASRGRWYRTDDVTDDAHTERRARSIARGVALLDDARDGSTGWRRPAPSAPPRLETRSRDARERVGGRRGREFARTVPSGDPHAPSARGFRQTNVSMGDERVRGGWAVEVREAHERGVRQRGRQWGGGDL